MTVQQFIKKLVRLVELERNAEINAMLDEMKRLSGRKERKRVVPFWVSQENL